MDEWISKKDLLKETGISYGQLYRWKREGLIPDSWFVKRSAFTGQETFLPRDKILDRVYFILDNKEEHSFSQIAAMLNPGTARREYTADLLMTIPNTLQPMIALSELTGSTSITHAQAILVLLAAKAAKSCPSLTEAEQEALMKALWKWQKELNFLSGSEGSVTLLKGRMGFLPLLARPEAEIVPGGDYIVIFRMTVADMQMEFTQMLLELEEEA